MERLFLDANVLFSVAYRESAAVSRLLSTTIAPALRSGVELPEKDWPIVAGALASRATHFITGDAQHFGSHFVRSSMGPHAGGVGDDPSYVRSLAGARMTDFTPDCAPRHRLRGSARQRVRGRGPGRLRAGGGGRGTRQAPRS